jgi:hypothetical protein
LKVSEKMQNTSATDFMIDDLVNVYEIKKKLVEQSVKRLLDVHLGNYVPEEGEIVRLWEPVELEIVARRIARYNIEKLKIQEEDDEEKEEYEENYEYEENQEYDYEENNEEQR